MPLMRGDEVARRLIAEKPELKILAVSSFDNPQYILTMLENGARGFLTKDEAPELLQKAADEIIRNNDKIWVSEKLKQQTGVNIGPSVNSALTLSQTEHRILEMLKAGASKDEIADEFSFSDNQLERYLKILLIKFDVSSVEALIETQ